MRTRAPSIQIRRVGVAPSGAKAVVIAIAGAAAVLYLWRIGSSSWFVDEASSATIAAAGPRSFAHQLRFVEQNPPGYFALLNLWSHLLRTTSEAWLRLPSALVATVLVGAVARLAFLIAGEWAAISAALFAAVSPFNLEYAQQARPYAFLAALVALAAVAALEAVRRRSRRWLAAAAVLGAASVWIHYFAVLVVAPLMLWLARRRELRRSDRTVALAAVALAWVLSLPLAYVQFRHKPAGGVGSYGDFSLGHIIWVIGAPFDGRYGTGPGAVQAFGAAVVVTAIVLLARDKGVTERRLLLALVVITPAALVLLSVAGRNVLISRYAAASVPFAGVAVAIALTRLDPLVSRASLLAVVGVAAAGAVASELPGAAYPPTRQVTAAIAAGWRPGDVIDDASSNFAVDYTLRYYATRSLGRPLAIYAGTSVARYARVWLVSAGRSAGVPSGFRVLEVRQFDGDLPLSDELLVPRDRR